MENGRTIVKSELQVGFWRREDGNRENGRGGGGKKEGKDIQIMMI